MMIKPDINPGMKDANRSLYFWEMVISRGNLQVSLAMYFQICKARHFDSFF